MNEKLLLNTELAEWLFETTAKNLPIIDYHNHLCMKELLEDRQFENLARLWVLSDPYKHRAMRICGVQEKYITGDATDYEKYGVWMDTLPKLIGNPLYEWSVMEMKRIFGIDLDVDHMDHKLIWEQTEKLLSRKAYSAKGLMKRFGVEYAAPCALIADDIRPFQSMKQIAPSLRGDNMTAPAPEMLGQLSEMTGIEIGTLGDYQEAIQKRLEDFEEAGCKFADHALDYGFCYVRDDGKNEERFRLFQKGEVLEKADQEQFASCMLRFLASAYAERNWTLQLHIGAHRHTSTRLRTIAGPAGGFAGIGGGCDVKSLTWMLDDMEQGTGGLPKIILYTLNPADNAVMSVLSGSFSQDGVAGKVQQGPAWWWCDHLYGMREVFENISAFSVLSAFVGMTTDSRSILSFVRHEYFRRTFCGWLGEKVEKGEITASRESLQKIVTQVCYENAKCRIVS